MSFTFSAKELPKQHFINNEYTQSKNHRTYSVFNPSDNSLVADDLPIAGEAEVDAAVEAGEKAFPQWKKFTATARRDILLKFAALIEKHKEPLSELTRITLGAPRGAFGKFEVGMAAEVSSNLYGLHALLTFEGFQILCGMD